MANGVAASRPAPDPGDVDGFVVAAYEAHHAELFALLARATLDPSLAGDLLEVAFGRLAAEARAGRPPTPVRPWLQRAACALALDQSSRPGSGRRRPEIDVGGRERRTEMDNVLAGLSPDARLALLLSGQGVRGEQIAAAIGRTPEATRTLLSVARARVRLRRELSEGGS